MPASNIDFTTLTHVIHFSVIPNSDGTLNATANDLSTAYSSDLVTRAHAAGRTVLICVGGADSEINFQSATGSTNLSSFINNLTNFMAVRGYDGVDLDWEPMPSSDAQQFTNLVIGLRSALNAFPTHKLLTAASIAYPEYGDSATAIYSMYASVQNQFDQINVMDYDLSGAYEGWVTWFNSPLYDGGYHFPSNSSELVPSTDASTSNYLKAGVAAAKLSISTAFYGTLWTHGSGTNATLITGPRQSWTNAPTTTALRYSWIISSNYSTNLYHYDTIAQNSYVGMTNASPTNNIFLSYDDPHAIQAKISYARNHNLGGFMIWEIAQDHVSPAASPLLTAIKQALATTGSISVQTSNSDVDLTFNTIALGSYNIQWTSNFTGGWNSLLITNISGMGAPLTIKDPGAVTNQTVRYYRIKTPP